MNKQLLERAADLARRGESFVLAVVVRREPYSSSQQGDAAIITADGAYHGWLGGNCTRPQVVREAACALIDGKPRLISLSPEPELPSRAGVTPLPMICHSGGTVDIFLEPVLAAPRMVVFGCSPVARAVTQLSKAMGYLVDVVDRDAHAEEWPDAAHVFTDPAAAELTGGGKIASVVVASMGEHDEDAITAALAMRPAYLGVVASRRRFAELRNTLIDRGISAHALDAIKSPAGLDLGGRQPEEVALSILAEIVQHKYAAPAEATTATTPELAAPLLAAVPPTEAPATAIDPVCRMSVTIATARHVGTWSGQCWYFCTPRCKDRFLADPERYLATASAGAAR